MSDPWIFHIVHVWKRIHIIIVIFLLYSLWCLYSTSSRCPHRSPVLSLHYPTFKCSLLHSNHLVLSPIGSQLLKEINRTSVSRALRVRRQAAQSEPKAYVTAQFKTLPPEFTLGDGRNYADFRNRPLLNGQEYVFFVLALMDLTENVSTKDVFMMWHIHSPSLQWLLLSSSN